MRIQREDYFVYIHFDRSHYAIQVSSKVFKNLHILCHPYVLDHACKSNLIHVNAACFLQAATDFRDMMELRGIFGVAW